MFSEMMIYEPKSPPQHFCTSYLVQSVQPDCHQLLVWLGNSSSWEKLEFISYVPQMFVGLFLFLFFFKVGSVCVCVYIYIYIYIYIQWVRKVFRPP